LPSRIHESSSAYVTQITATAPRASHVILPYKRTQYVSRQYHVAPWPWCVAQLGITAAVAAAAVAAADLRPSYYNADATRSGV